MANPNIPGVVIEDVIPTEDLPASDPTQNQLYQGISTVTVPAPPPQAAPVQEQPPGLLGNTRQTLQYMGYNPDAAQAKYIVSEFASPKGHGFKKINKIENEFLANQNKIFQANLKAQQEKTEAERQIAQQQALAAQGYQTAANALLEHTNAKVAANEAEQTRLISTIKSQQANAAAMNIDPDRWLASRSTGQKIALAIAAALDGFTMGLNRQSGPNPTLSLINHYIDRDIEVQKATLAKAGAEAEQSRGLLGSLFAQNGDIKQSAAMAKDMMLARYQGQVQEIVARNQDPIIQAGGTALAGGIQESRNKLGLEIHTRQVQREMASRGKRKTDFEIALDLNSKIAQKSAQYAENIAKEKQSNEETGGTLTPKQKDRLDELSTLREVASKALFSGDGADAKSAISRAEKVLGAKLDRAWYSKAWHTVTLQNDNKVKDAMKSMIQQIDKEDKVITTPPAEKAKLLKMQQLRANLREK